LSRRCRPENLESAASHFSFPYSALGLALEAVERLTVAGDVIRQI
jgi:hypothetical protein